MTPIRKLLAPALALGAMLAHGAHAQTTLPLSFEVRGGVAFPTGDFADGASTGWTVDGTVRYTVQPTLELYAGYQHASFEVDDSQDLEGVDVGIADDGARAGARLLMGGVGAVRPWVEAGLIYNRTSVSGSDGETSVTFDSDWGLGFEAGAGFTLDLSPQVALTPGVRYRQHSTHFDLADVGEGDLDASYVAVDMGINFHF